MEGLLKKKESIQWSREAVSHRIKKAISRKIRKKVIVL